MYYILFFIGGVIIERKFSPSISIENKTVFFHYKNKLGRNKKKLFNF
jgi:hypothetical protein